MGPVHLLTLLLALAAQEAEVPPSAPVPPLETTTPEQPPANPAEPPADAPQVAPEASAELAEGAALAEQAPPPRRGSEHQKATPSPTAGSVLLAQLPWPVLAVLVGLVPLLAGVLALGAAVVLAVAANTFLFGLAATLQSGPMSLHPRGPDLVGILTMGGGVLIPVLLSAAVTTFLALGAYLGWRKAVQPHAPSPRAASRALRAMMAWPVVCGVGAGCCGFPVSLACAAGAVVAQLAALGGGCAATLLGCGFLCLTVPTTLILMGGPLVLAALVAPWGAASAGAGVVGEVTLEGDPP